MRRKRKLNKKNGVNSPKSAPNDDINPEAEDFYQDEVEQFHSKRSEQRAKKIRNLEPVVSSDDDDEMDYSEEEDVLGIGTSEEDYDEEYEENAMEEPGDQAESSDEESSEVAVGGPSEKAWGKKKSTFYSTDFIDDELGGSSNEEAAEEEELEAIALQKRMAAALQEEDFEVAQLVDTNPTAAVKPAKKTASDAEIVTQDLSKLSRDEKLEILAKDSPELFELLEDYREKLTGVIELQPLLELARSHDNLLTTRTKEWLELKTHLTLCYCTNIVFYLLLKSQQCPVKTHPVIGQLVEYRKLLSQLESMSEEINDEVTRGQEILSEEDGEQQLLSLLDEAKKTGTGQRGSNKSESKPNKKEVVKPSKRKQEEDPLDYYYKVKKAKKEKKDTAAKSMMMEGDEDDKSDEESNEKRAITYQISRNKGLTPKRKKEQRNPRVKHRKKFRKAVIKRRSQVPDVVNEQARYGGELTGIRANLSRSIKIK